MSEEIDHDRRRLLEAVAMAAAIVPLGLKTTASAITPNANTTFGPLKKIDAGVLNVGYAEAGPIDGPPVVLLHGWPYDIHTYVDVAPLLSSKGYRVIVPFLRGYGTTDFLSTKTIRNGQPSAIASD